MTYRLLLDENVERAVAHKLRNYGHDVEHVDELQKLGKGTTDTVLASYTRQDQRLLVTYDDDFVTEFSPQELYAVLFVSNDNVSPAAVSDAVHRMSEQYPQSAFDGVEWLDPWL